MAIRQDSATILNLNIGSFTDKAAIRNYLLQQWIIETPHTKYRYFVETLANGSRIYLERPGRLNKGCDFVIYAENLFLHGNGNDKPPAFKDLLEDFANHKSLLTDPQKQSLLSAIQTIHDVGSYQTAIQQVSGITATGLTFETILKLLRWFFAEQDLTYWSGTGRAMLLQAIKDEL